MEKKKSNKPAFKVPIPFIAENEKEDDPKEKTASVEFTTDLAGNIVPNLTIEFQHIFQQGKVEPYFKWISNLQNIMGNHTVRENYACALNTLKGSDRDLWLAQCNANGPDLADQNIKKHKKKPCPSHWSIYYQYM
jgi:hypothetical protein